MHRQIKIKYDIIAKTKEFGVYNMILIENQKFCLKLNSDCTAESLVLKETGEECLMADEKTPFFSLTENRPWNNEIKLAYPTRRTTFQANRVRREGNNLIVGFDLVMFEAVIEIKEAPTYVTFALKDFIVGPEDFGLCPLVMEAPPVDAFRLVQLPVAQRERFGQWLNVMWDDKAAIGVIATSEYEQVDSENRKGFKIMTADTPEGIKLKGCEVALIVSSQDKFLDVVEQIEEDYDLPRGVKSRRSEHINRSVYWTHAISPQNVDEHIKYAKMGGFTKMLIYYPAVCKQYGHRPYCTTSDYTPGDDYENGYEDIKAMLKRIKDAGIDPGIHFLQTHVGSSTKYVTPVADHRLNLRQKFTLSKPLGTDDTEVYVEQNPEGCIMHEKGRVLMFDGELIYYDSYTTERPYCFKGCKRGHWDTNVVPHNMGARGGILDISEYGGGSVYIDQTTSLQDEIADEIAKMYDCGFEFIYFDGSEGTNPPFGYNISNAQYRVYKKLGSAPLFCEGAAKTHFGWHMLSGANAFDRFPADIFKKMIVKFPMDEAAMMANDFTRVNFGWWMCDNTIQPDHYEYGTSRAAAWDCPGTIQIHNISEDAIAENPRFVDSLEVFRRWEDVRKKNLLTKEQKEMLKDSDTEHILIINEQGEYELLPYEEIKTADESVSAFVFERCGKTCVVCWHKTGDGQIEISLDDDNLAYFDEIGGEKIAIEKNGNKVTIPVGKRRYLISECDRDKVIKAFM